MAKNTNKAKNSTGAKEKTSLSSDVPVGSSANSETAPVSATSGEETMSTSAETETAPTAPATGGTTFHFRKIDKIGMACFSRPGIRSTIYIPFRSFVNQVPPATITLSAFSEGVPVAFNAGVPVKPGPNAEERLKKAQEVSDKAAKRAKDAKERAEKLAARMGVTSGVPAQAEGQGQAGEAQTLTAGDVQTVDASQL